MSDGQLTTPVGTNDHAAGLDDAPVTLVEYGDFECPYCGMAYPVVKSAQRELGKQLRFVFRNFPLAEAHPHALFAAEAAEAAAAQGKFWEMHDLLFEHQDALEPPDIIGYAKSLGLDMAQLARDLKDPKYTKRVRDDFRSGVRSGVNGTPTFFINGSRFEGSWANEKAFVAFAWNDRWTQLANRNSNSQAPRAMETPLTWSYCTGDLA
jgi:protein-disulfide isomerase